MRLRLYSERGGGRGVWSLAAIALPAALQNFAFSAQQVIDTIMVAHLADDAVAALAFCGTAFLVITSALFGIVLATGALVSQHWGGGKLNEMREFLYLSIGVSIIFVLPVVVVFITKPDWVMQLATDSRSVIDAGSAYLRIAGLSLLVWPVTVGIGMSLNMIGQARLSMFLSIAFVVAAISLNYVFIFGLGPIPELGIRGAALGTLITNVVFLLVNFAVVVRRTHPFHIRKARLRRILDQGMCVKLLRQAMPLMMNGLLWAGGLFAYHVLFGQLGQVSLTVFALVSPVITLSMVVFNGLSTATSAEIGRNLGEGSNLTAIEIAWTSIKLALLLGVLSALVLSLLWQYIFIVFPEISHQVINALRPVYIVATVFIWVRGLNIVLINGILRSGADNDFIFKLDTTTTWAVGVPLTVVAAFVFNAPLFIVYLCSLSEEMLKALFALRRVHQNKWIRSLL